jgi:preprotein translocase subunit YajC
MTMWTGRREKKKREAMLATVKRGDKVRMSGGLIATVHELTDTEIVVRMEEGRARFDRSAVAGVLKEAKAGSIAEPKEAGKALSV